jgi:hypothetical protein
MSSPSPGPCLRRLVSSGPLALGRKRSRAFASTKVGADARNVAKAVVRRSAELTIGSVAKQSRDQTPDADLVAEALRHHSKSAAAAAAATNVPMLASPEFDDPNLSLETRCPVADPIASRQ